MAGTGGKGSTCRFLEMGLSCAGKAGAFLSPHLFDYRERIVRAYPREGDGSTLFPFRRLFIVAAGGGR